MTTREMTIGAFVLQGWQTELVAIDGAEALFSGQQFAGFVHLDRSAAKEMMAALKPKR